MNNILLNYLLKNFLKAFLIIVFGFYCFGLLLSLFEEIEFFKNTNSSIFIPLLLSGIFVPSLIIKILPFIIFISSMWFTVKIRNNKDLLTLKVFGYSNLKIFFILAFTSFTIGWLILFIINPITSSLSIYYEKTKSRYSKDIDHLVSFTKNGLWIKENIDNKTRIISADKPSGYELINVKIYHLKENSNLEEKIYSKTANIKDKTWVLNDVSVFSPKDGVITREDFNSLKIESTYNYEKINSIFKNFNTLSFLDLINNYKKLVENGYNKSFLDQSLHTMLALPFFLFVMTALAAIFTMNTLRKSNNYKLFTIALATCVATFYFNDLSLALGKTERIPLVLSIWAPVLALSFFTFIGILQINEK